MSGLTLATMAGVSQSRTSRVIGTLVDRGLVQQAKTGYHPTDWQQLLDWWLAHYPGPGGTLSYWASTKDINTQARDVLAALGGTRAAVSGDPAVDLLAPWRLPTLAVIYVDHGLPLSDLGFVPVGDMNEATLTMCAPTDPGVWLPSPWTFQGVPLADPIQIVYDAANGSEPDRPEAAKRLAATLTSRHLQTWRNTTRRDRL